MPTSPLACGNYRGRAIKDASVLFANLPWCPNGGRFEVDIQSLGRNQPRNTPDPDAERLPSQSISQLNLLPLAPAMSACAATARWRSVAAPGRRSRTSAEGESAR
jgi:hypothetical protein